MDQLYPDVGVSAVRLLQRLGCDVSFPKGQTCCGQPAFNSGYVDSARQVALNNLKTFEKADYVVSPSGSCAGMVHHYYHDLFKDNPRLAADAQSLADRTYELSQSILNDLKVTDVGARFPHTVAYHPSCHGSRLLGVKTEPMQLLKSVRDIEILPIAKSQDCCGFGGTFAVKMADVSGAMVGEKVDCIASTDADYLVGADMGCLMNISGAMRRRGLPTQALHLAQLLNSGVEGWKESRV